MAGGRYIKVDIDREKAARYGLSIAVVQQIIATAVGGMNVTNTVEGLERLRHGPLHVVGEDNRLGAAILRGEDRRQSIALMSAGSAGLYGLPIPTLPDTDDSTQAI